MKTVYLQFFADRPSDAFCAFGTRLRDAIRSMGAWLLELSPGNIADADLFIAVLGPESLGIEHPIAIRRNLGKPMLIFYPANEHLDGQDLPSDVVLYSDADHILQRVERAVCDGRPLGEIVRAYF